MVYYHCIFYEVVEMEANQYFVYLFRVKKTQEVIYVGSCKNISKRLNEHRRAFREPKHELPIHKYMMENNLELFTDVEVVIVEYSSNMTKQKAWDLEAEYYHRYKDTLKNTRPAEIRTGIYAPRSKPVRCLNDGRLFCSIRQAAEHYGIVRNSLMKHLNEGVRLRCELLFEYVGENDEEARRKLYVVRCVEDDKYFQFFTNCARYYGIPKSRFEDAARDGAKRWKCGGRTFERCNDYSERKYTQARGNGENPSGIVT